MGVMMKGAAMKPYVDWIRRQAGPDGWRTLSLTLSDADRASLETLAGGAPVPAEVLGRLFAAYAGTHLGSDRALIAATFARMGRWSADEHLGGVYSVFARFAGPHLALSKVPSILAAMYTGAEASVEQAADGRGGVLRVNGLGVLPYSGPRLTGWGQRALERFGAKDVRLAERTWAAGADASDALVFDVGWS